MPRQLRGAPFSKEVLLRLLGGEQPVHYVAEYLQDLAAATVLIEEHYVDRHFLDDFAHYYSRSFTSPPAFCKRLHFFSDPPARVLQLMGSAYGGSVELREAERQLNQKYLGFLVARPLPGATIGRTVLRTYPEEGRRSYPVVRPYRVHLAGLELVIKGLAYQEQDGGAAVCASTALWSALQRVAHVAGGRSPTPSAITRASGTPFPASHGLNELQMANALSGLGFVADLFSPADNRYLFRAKVAACLRSGLPVVLLVTARLPTGAGLVDAGHAITLTGFREPTWRFNVPAAQAGVDPVKMKDGSLEVVYAHDDNLGPHAHYEFFDSTDRNLAGHEKLMIRRGDPSRPAEWWTPDEWVVEGALVPKPHGLRLAIERLMFDVLLVRRLFEQLLEGADVHYEARFATGVDYKRSLLEANFNPSQMQSFQCTASFPRHIGIVTIFSDNERLVEIVLDVTEVGRMAQLPVLAFVGYCPADSEAGIYLSDLVNSIPRRPGFALLTQPPAGPQPSPAVLLQTAAAVAGPQGSAPAAPEGVPPPPPSRATPSETEPERGGETSG